MERMSLSAVTKPPFDGGEPCVACAVQVRDLSAVVHNLIVAWDSYRNATDEWKASELSRVAQRFHSVRQSHATLHALVEAHFADRMHSHGQVN